MKTSNKKEQDQLQSTSWMFELDHIHPYAFWEKAFTSDECDELIKIGNQIEKKKALVGLNAKKSKIRDCEVSWLYPNDDTRWAFEKLTRIVTDLNNKFFNFDLFGCVEGFQFTKYVSPSGKYGKHVDSYYNNLIRKLSFTLQLSNENDYEGGDLCIYLDEKAIKIKKEKGYVVVFPSYVMHEVKPVTKGTRYSLVSWVTGKPFK